MKDKITESCFKRIIDCNEEIENSGGAEHFEVVCKREIQLALKQQEQRIMDMVRYYGKDTWSDVWDCIESGLEPHELEEKGKQAHDIEKENLLKRMQDPDFPVSVEENTVEALNKAMR